MSHKSGSGSVLSRLEVKQNHRSFSAQMVKISQLVNRGLRQISPARFHKQIMGEEADRSFQLPCTVLTGVASGCFL